MNTRNRKLVVGVRRPWPLMMSCGSASVMLLAFLVPSIHGDHEKSENALQEAVDLRPDPQNLQAHSDLWLLYAGQGSKEDAVAQLRLAIELDPSDTALTNRLTELGGTVAE